MERMSDERVMEAIVCAASHDAGVRLFGNITAGELAKALDELLDRRRFSPRLAQPEAEREGLRVDLSMWSDETKRAIYYALHRDPACVPRSTAHGSGANPIAPPPDGRAG